MIKYISLRSENLVELCKVWNKEIGNDFPMNTHLFDQNCFTDGDIQSEASAIAWDEHIDKTIGFIAAKLNGERGSISSMIVASEYRNRGIGGAMLAKAEAALLKSGVKSIELGRDFRHFFSGIPSQYAYVKNWFEKRDYIHTDKSYDLICDFSGRKVDYPRIGDVEFKLLKNDRKESFLSFLSDEFPERWRFSAEQQLIHNHSERDFVVALKNREIIGFLKLNLSTFSRIATSMNWVPHLDRNYGGIGPLGIACNHRGNGYGSGILQVGIYFLQQFGCHKIVIDWTQEIAFYGKFGFAKWKSYDGYIKEFFGE